jgi:hypothetical protein
MSSSSYASISFLPIHLPSTLISSPGENNTIRKEAKTIPDEIPIPDGQVARKKLHFFWLADSSESMRGKKIATLNQAIREAVPEIRKAVASYPQVDIQMRAIRFSDNAEWHTGPEPVRF